MGNIPWYASSPLQVKHPMYCHGLGALHSLWVLGPPSSDCGSNLGVSSAIHPPEPSPTGGVGWLLCYLTLGLNDNTRSK